MKTEKVLFEIPSTNGAMVDTHFYKWLTRNNITDHNTISTRKDYLASLGFNIEIHKIDSVELCNLKYILEHHYINEIKNKH